MGPRFSADGGSKSLEACVEDLEFDSTLTQTSEQGIVVDAACALEGQYYLLQNDTTCPTAGLEQEPCFKSGSLEA